MAASLSSDVPPPGGWDETPPAVNAKCIVLTLLLAGGYWLLPSRNKWVMLALLYSTYAFIADADALSDCKLALGPSALEPLYRWTKPQNTRQFEIYRKWDPKIKRPLQLVNYAVLLGLLALVPLFLSWNPTPSADPQQAASDDAAGIGFLLLCGATMLVLKRKLEKRPGILP